MNNVMQIKKEKSRFISPTVPFELICYFNILFNTNWFE